MEHIGNYVFITEGQLDWVLGYHNGFLFVNSIAIYVLQVYCSRCCYIVIIFYSCIFLIEFLQVSVKTCFLHDFNKLIKGVNNVCVKNLPTLRLDKQLTNKYYGDFSPLTHRVTIYHSYFGKLSVCNEI